MSSRLITTENESFLCSARLLLPSARAWRVAVVPHSPQSVTLVSTGSRYSSRFAEQQRAASNLRVPYNVLGYGPVGARQRCELPAPSCSRLLRSAQQKLDMYREVKSQLCCGGTMLSLIVRSCVTPDQAGSFADSG